LGEEGGQLATASFEVAVFLAILWGVHQVAVMRLSLTALPRGELSDRHGGESAPVRCSRSRSFSGIGFKLIEDAPGRRRKAQVDHGLALGVGERRALGGPC
jgi:hypothetical protein